MLELDLALKATVPWKTDQFYKDYFALMQAAYVRGECEAKFQIRRYLVVIQLLFALTSARLVYFYLNVPEKPITSVVYCDLIWLLGLESSVNLIFLAFIIVVPAVHGAFYGHWNYIQPTVAGILVRQETEFFIRGCPVPSGTQANPAVQLCRFTLRVVNLLQVFALCNDLALLYIQCALFVHLYKHGWSFAPTYHPITATLLAWIQAEFWFLVSAFFFLHMVHIVTLAGVLCITSVKLFQIKIQQLSWYLGRLACKKRFTGKSERHLIRWQRTYRRFVIFLMHGNRGYSWLLVIFLLLNFPANCYVTLTSLYYRMSLQLKLFMLAIWLYQMLAIFGLHYFMALFNGRLHKPNKPLFGLAARHHFSGCSLLRLSNHLQTFHTKRGYGFTYGQFGRISMWSFTKNVISYSELLMFLYQLLFCK